jgi:hypothetical protein
VLVPASDEDLLRAWYRLGFGQQQAHAVRAPPGEPPASEPPAAQPKVVVRRAERNDLPALARLEVELPRQQSLAPVFSPSPVPSYPHARGFGLAGHSAKRSSRGPRRPATTAS